MNYRLTPALLFLAMAPAAHAVTITDDTPARAITITKFEPDMPRVIYANEIMTMAQCREGLKENVEALKDSSDFILCVPADMREPGRPDIDLPLIDLNQ